MNDRLKATLTEILNFNSINDQRKAVLQPLVVYIQDKINKKQSVNLNFICTHNSRRSHFAQIWAQFASAYYNVQNVNCYSGGTEATSLFPKVADTLSKQGFEIVKLSQDTNPVYAIKFNKNSLPIIGFSKNYDHPFNPISEFAAILTCSKANDGCPFIAGADIRIPLTFEDPKISDGTLQQTEVYKQRSVEIAIIMMYIFSKIKN